MVSVFPGDTPPFIYRPLLSCAEVVSMGHLPPMHWEQLRAEVRLHVRLVCDLHSSNADSDLVSGTVSVHTGVNWRYRIQRRIRC